MHGNMPGADGRNSGGRNKLNRQEDRNMYGFKWKVTVCDSVGIPMPEHAYEFGTQRAAIKQMEREFQMGRKVLMERIDWMEEGYYER